MVMNQAAPMRDAIAMSKATSRMTGMMFSAQSMRYVTIYIAGS
jgi:hypothetical protein